MFDCFKFEERINTTKWIQDEHLYELDWRDHGEDWDDLYGCIMTLEPLPSSDIASHRIHTVHKVF